MTPHGTIGSHKQERFIACLLAAPDGNMETAARSAGISIRTAWRWWKEEAIQARLKEARKEEYARAVAGLLSLIDDAVKELRTVLQDDVTPHAVKLRAVQLIFEHSHVHMVDIEVDERMSRIEAAFEKGV